MNEIKNPHAVALGRLGGIKGGASKSKAKKKASKENGKKGGGRRCSVEGCGRPHEGKGFCPAHLFRFNKHGDAMKGIPIINSKKARIDFVKNNFHIFYDVSALGCWEWNRSFFVKTGYGRIKVGNKTRLAHRLSYEIHRGDIPAGMLVCHTCDNRKCVNPDHLFLGDHQANTDDCAQKGRRANLKGVQCPWSKLSVHQVQEIRRRYAQGETQLALGVEFGVSQTNVGRIVNRKTYSNI